MTPSGTSLAPPTVGRPASFTRYLRRAAARRRRRVDSGLRYELVVAALWFGPGVVFGAWQGFSSAVPPDPPLTWAAASFLLLSVVFALGWGFTVMGPVAASAEWRSWVLSTPLDRGSLLRRRVIGTPMPVIAPAVLAGAILAYGSGIRGPSVPAVLVMAVGIAVAVGGVTVVLQARRTEKATARRIWPILAAATAVAAVPLNWLNSRPPAPGMLWGAAALTVVTATAAVAVAAASAGRLSVAGLAAGSGTLTAAALSAQYQSLEPLSGAIGGQLPGLGRRPSRPFAGVGRQAVRSLAWRRLLRSRPVLVRSLVALAVPYAAWFLLDGVGWGAAGVAVLTFVAAAAAISGSCGTVRQFASNPALADRYGLSADSSARSALLPPAVGAVVWALLAAPALIVNGVGWMALAAPALAVILVLYRASRPAYEPSFVMGKEYSADLMRRFFRGPAQYLICCVIVGLLAAGRA